MLIDTHVHLNEIEGVRQAIESAKSVGIHRIVAVGMDQPSNEETLELARKYPDAVVPAVGYHPWKIRTEEIEPTLAFIEENLSGCIALGEVGLDYKVKVKKPIQKDVFFRLLRLAETHEKPVIVHSRFSYERTHRMVVEAGIEKAVFHWFSGPLEILDRILSDGYYVSATPALAYSKHHQSCIAHAPLNRILIETDAPQEYQGIPSVPSDLVKTLELLSRLKNAPIDQTARITTENAKKFYGI